MRNKLLREEFDFVFITTSPHDNTQGHSFIDVLAHIPHAPDAGVIKMVEDFFTKNHVTHAILCQPLFWYTSMAAGVCARLGIKVVYHEAYPGGYHIFDTMGCQYCHDNEIVRYSHRVKRQDPRIPDGTRYQQPPTISSREIYRK